MKVYLDSSLFLILVFIGMIHLNVFGDELLPDSVKLAPGSVLKIKAESLSDSDGNVLDKFAASVKVYASSPSFKKNVYLKLLQKPSVKLPLNEITVAWNKNVKVIEKKVVNQAYKAGKKFKELDTPEAVNVEIHILVKDEVGEKNYILPGVYQFVMPKISDVLDSKGNRFEKIPSPSSIINLTGKYFGLKNPAVWLEYPSVKGVKQVKCKVLKPLKFSDYKGKSGKSCMNTETGESYLSVQLPKKWPKGWVPEEEDIVIFNKTGYGTAPIPYKEKSYSISGIISGAVSGGVMLSISGDKIANSVSSADGTYSFSDIQDGNYTITPILDGYSFSPSSQSVTVSGADLNGVNFTSTVNAAPTFTLTVNNGTGSGDYEENETVFISANIPSGQVFDLWTGDIQYIADVNSPSTTVTMPASDVTVTATFKDAPVDSFSISGTIIGDIQEGVTVSVDSTHSVVSAADGTYIIAGLTDGTYTVTPTLDGYSFSPNSQSVTVSGADLNGVNFTSTVNAAPTFNLIVNNGTGSGDYEENEIVSISANIPSGQVFDVWTGDIQYITDVNAASTTVTMPASDITVAAIFKDFAYSLSGTVSGDIIEGVTITLDNGDAVSTDSQGQFVFNGLIDGVYTVTPSFDGYLFKEPSLQVIVNGSDVNDINFSSFKQYSLTVVNGEWGEGSGNYISGDTVPIFANVPDGQVFSHWSGDVQYLDNAHSETAIVTMPDKDISVTAEFEDAPNFDDGLILYCKFDDSLDNEIEVSQSPTVGNPSALVYTDGIKGKAVTLTTSTVSNMNLPEGLLRKDKGSITMWLSKVEGYGYMWGQCVLQSQKTGGESKWFLHASEHRLRWQLNYDDNSNVLASKYFMPNRNEWMNIAITWDADTKDIALYVNGELTSYLSKQKCEDLPGSYFGEKIFFSLAAGAPQRALAIDELRFYDRALKDYEVSAMVKEDMPVKLVLRNMNRDAGMVNVADDSGICECTRNLKLLTGKNFSGDILLETFDEENNLLWSNEENVTLANPGDFVPLKWNLPLTGNEEAMNIKATLINAASRPAWGVKVLATRRPVSYISDQDENLKFKKILEYDCLTEKDGENFYTNNGVAVIDNATGKYIETPADDFSFFSCRFNIKNPHKYHMIKVYYPDNAKRIFDLDVNDGSGLNPQGAGIVAGLNTRLSNTMQEQSFFFIPDTENCLLTACTRGEYVNNIGSVKDFVAEFGAAISKFEVYELDMGSLPVMEIPELDQRKGRTVGFWIEDASVTGFWGNSTVPKTIEQAAKVAKNLTEYMDYIGANEYQYPALWYDGGLFNCPTLDLFNNPAETAINHPKGFYHCFMEYMNRRNIKFYPSIYFRKFAGLFYQTDIDYPDFLNIGEENWNQRYRTNNPGGNDMFQYYKNGEHRLSAIGQFLPDGASVGPVFNPLHPNVSALYQGILRDWLEQYANDPGLGGVLLDLGATWGGLPQADSVSFDRLNSGYGDYTMSLFEKDTNIDVPGEPDDDRRFQERYDFLTSDSMRETFISWRCEQIKTKVILPAYNLVKSYNSNLKLKIVVGTRPGIGDAALKNDTDWKTAARECGIDVELFADYKDIEFYRQGQSFQNVTKCYPNDELDQSFPLDNYKDSGAMVMSSSYWEMFPYASLMDPVKAKWPEVKANQLPVREMTDVREGVLARAAYMLMKKEMNSIYIGGGMGFPATFGNEDVVRPFLRSFRFLPDVAFDDIQGLTDPVRGRWKTIDQKLYFYLVNAEPYPIEATVNFDKQIDNVYSVSDMSDINVASDSFTVTIPPYQLMSFEVEDNVNITNGSSVTNQQEFDTLVDSVNNIKQELYQIVDEYVPEDSSEVYVWHENENWKRWDSTEHYSSSNGPQSANIPDDVVMSNYDDIAFGGDQIPVEYDLNIPQDGKYYIWQRFTVTELNKNPSHWSADIAGTEIGSWLSPVAGEELWVKVGEVDLTAGPITYAIYHRTGVYSISIDCFLFTTDADYTPGGTADHQERKESLDQKFETVDEYIQNEEIAKLRVMDFVFKYSE